MSVSETGRKTRRKTQDAADQATDRAEGASEEARGSGSEDDSGSDSGSSTLMGELKTTMREAAVEVLKPVARKATLSVAKVAVSQGPSLVKDKLGPMISDAGGPAEMVKGLADKGGALTDKIPFIGGGDDEEGGGKKGKGATGTGRGRRLPVQEFVDVAADIETVYDQFTQFEDWPRFMHRVEKIEQRDETTLMWHENIWGVRRQWEAEITDQEPCVRIAWRSKGNVETVGVATFHKLSDHLTRIYLTVDFQPKGVLEKSASGFRLSRRAIKSDLMRFKAFVEMRDDSTGSWRGRIEDGDVVESPEDREDGRDEEERDEEPRDEEYDEPEGEEEPEAEDEPEEEPQAEEEFDDEDEADEEDEERQEERPRRRKGRFSRAEESEDEEEDEEPEAEYVDDEEEEEVEEKPKPKPKRRSTRAKAKTSSRGK